MVKNVFLIDIIVLLFNVVVLEPIYDVSIDDSYIVKETYKKLVIPKIDLEEYFFLDDNPQNDLSKGIYTMKSNSKNDNVLLLASHSGNGIHSYFKNLEKLTVGDEFFIKNNFKEERYVIYENNYKEKDGRLIVKKSKNKEIILITCSKKFIDKQVYYMAFRV